MVKATVSPDRHYGSNLSVMWDKDIRDLSHLQPSTKDLPRSSIPDIYAIHEYAEGSDRDLVAERSEPMALDYGNCGNSGILSDALRPGRWCGIEVVWSPGSKGGEMSLDVDQAERLVDAVDIWDRDPAWWLTPLISVVNEYHIVPISDSICRSVLDRGRFAE